MTIDEKALLAAAKSLRRQWNLRLFNRDSDAGWRRDIEDIRPVILAYESAKQKEAEGWVGIKECCSTEGQPCSRCLEAALSYTRKDGHNGE